MSHPTINTIKKYQLYTVDNDSIIQLVNPYIHARIPLQHLYADKFPKLNAQIIKKTRSLEHQ